MLILKSHYLNYDLSDITYSWLQAQLNIENKGVY